MNSEGEIVCGRHGLPWCDTCGAEVREQLKGSGTVELDKLHGELAAKTEEFKPDHEDRTEQIEILREKARLSRRGACRKARGFS